MIKHNVKKEFGAAVRAYRQRLGISQETLAERAQLHRTYITDVERGARNISLESISRLAAALELSISSLFAAPPPANRDWAEAPPGLEIVLVEDDARDVELTLAAFAAARLFNPVEVLRDGAAALDFLLARGPYSHRRQAPLPLVILLDLHLPKVHGLQVLRSLRHDERTRTLHVVVLTNSRHSADVREALRLGAEAYLLKPVDFTALSSVTPHLNFGWRLLGRSDPSAGDNQLARRSLKV